MMVNGPTGTMAERPAMPPRPSAEEMARMKEEMFNRVDGDGNGSVDVVELSELAEKMREHGGMDLDAEELMSRMDTDGDGKLSQAELEKGMEEMRPPRDGGPPPGPPPGMPGESGDRPQGTPDLTSLLLDREA